MRCLPRKKLDSPFRFAYNNKVGLPEAPEQEVVLCCIGLLARKRVKRMLERLFHLADLLDLYGMLLTEKQRRCLELHLFDDFSLSEIGEAVGVSRQAVYDIIHRSEQALETYEQKLGLLKRLREEHEELAAIGAAIGNLRTETNGEAVDAVLQRIAALLGTRREV